MRAAGVSVIGSFSVELDSSLARLFNPAAPLRGPGCNGGTRASRSAPPKPRGQRLTTNLPHDIRHAPDRMPPVRIHLFRPRVCQKETEDRRANHTKLPDPAARSTPHIHRLAGNRRPPRPNTLLNIRSP